jgi:hypothetical protein
MVVLLVFLLLTNLLFRDCFCKMLVPCSTLATASLFTNSSFKQQRPQASEPNG